MKDLIGVAIVLSTNWWLASSLFLLTQSSSTIATQIKNFLQERERVKQNDFKFEHLAAYHKKLQLLAYLKFKYREANCKNVLVSMVPKG